MRTLLFFCLLLSYPLAQGDDPMAPLLKKLEDSHWVAVGSEQPERIAYLFDDMQCPYCVQLWHSMAPLLDDDRNTLQVRHILVGLINPNTSLTTAAAVLADDHPAQRLAEHKERFSEGGIAPLSPVPDTLRDAIRENTVLMIGLGLAGTPTLIFQDSEQRWRVAPGLISEGALRQQVFQF